MCRRSPHGNREILEMMADNPSAIRALKAIGRKNAMHVSGKSDSGVVPEKPPNKAVRTAAEVVEGRLLTEGNPDQPTVTGTQCPGQAASGLARIREAARKDGKQRFTSLMHHVTPAMLREAFEALKRDAAPGIDGMTWQAYGEELNTRISDLHECVQNGRYRAQPSRRAWIQKSDGRMRPLGIAAVDDKIVQLALVWILNAIYEEDFAGFSYGSRPGRSQHHALDAVWVGLTQRKVNWIVDADIRGFFDALDHEWLMKFVEHRVADPRVLRLIQQWLKAGVSEGGIWTRTTVGTPQGAVISPLLANMYLHYVLDLWVKWWRSRHGSGDVIIVRYVDDFVVGFQHRMEAEAFLKDLRERLARFRLELHPDKTRLIEFGRFAGANRAKRQAGKPETFDFLGFTHICGKRRKDGMFTILRQTISKRIAAKAREVRKRLMQRRHDQVPEQGRWLRSVVQGFFNYHAVPGNGSALNSFRSSITGAWFRALRRRSQKARALTWERMKRLIKTWIPTPRILHPYPNQRLVVNDPR